MTIDTESPGDPFGLATLRLADGEVAAIELGGRYWPLRRTFGWDGPDSVLALLDDWQEQLPKLRAHAAVAREGTRHAPISAVGVQRLAPLRYPRKVIGVAFNYAGQLKEMGLPRQPFDPMPFFVRPGSNTLIGPDEPLHMPQGIGLDWEVEIGVVMGRHMRHVSAVEGLRGIAAYTVAVDMTVRDLIPANNPFKTDLFRSKCQDDLSPLGPVLVPAEFIRNPQDLHLTLSINGALKQDARSSDMVVPVGELVSEVSRYLTWEPGDLLLTGTPAGTSGVSGQFLAPGDRVRAEIEGLGRLDFEVLPRLDTGRG